MNADAALADLKTRQREIVNLQRAAAVLTWDQSTYMPPGGGEARGQQIALLMRLYQEKISDVQLGRLLDRLAPYEHSLPYDHDDAALIRVARRNYERQVKIPADLYADFYGHRAESYQAWVRARPENDFAAVRPYLEKTLDYSRQIAECFPGYEHIADPLIGFFDYGMQARTIRQVFAALRAELVPLVAAITSHPPADDQFLRQNFPQVRQLEFAEYISRSVGYDFERGRLDLTHHPFMTRFSIGDVRITTRVDEHDLGNCLFSVIHETGHALYEQGVDPHFEGTPLARGASSGMHESQSRLWENLVGRSLPFWEYFYPQLQQAFPEQLADVELERFYRAINRVQPSLIRTEADEVTYNLHVMIRFDLELQMLEGTLAVKDLPDAWNARYASDLGLTPPDDRDGVLQDVHWYDGFIGGEFQGYTLGNLLSAMIFAQAQAAQPELTENLRQGQFTQLHTWLRENLYRHGRKYTPAELTERLTGGELEIAPLVSYLKRKYGALYAL